MAKSRQGSGPARGGDPEAEFQRAQRLLQAGDHRGAAKIADRLAGKLPETPAIRQLQGMIALAAGDPAKAVKALKKGLAAAANVAAYHDLLGTALAKAGRFAEAEAAYRQALRLKPGDAGVLNNLGNALGKLGRLEEGRDAYRQSLAIRPGHASTEINLGDALEKLEDHDGAEAAFGRALAVDARDPVALTGLGRALLAQGRLVEAKAVASRALAAAPNDAGAHEILGICHFLEGRFAEAWREYEWRWKSPAEGRREAAGALWAGEPLAGKRVLVWGEQGVGDEILFAGMVPDLIEAGAKVVLECDPRLIPLFERSFPGVRYRARGAAGARPDRTFDYQIPSGSLGRWLRPDLKAFPKRRSLLVADETRRDALRRKYLEAGGKFLVGLAWRSKNPRIGGLKSMRLSELASLFDVLGARFVDLQYGDTAAERATLTNATGKTLLHDDGIDQMADLDAFAAQVAAMDLVISVSNTTVHVAGALGIPAWVMLSTAPMWRWMSDSEDSPWYPSVRLFRQARRGEWADVVKRIRAALGAFVARGA